MAAALAQLVLLLHLAVIAFNVIGLVVIPLGAWRGWRFVRIRWWRLLHVASWSLVAVQAALGQACFLTVWQDQLSGRASGEPPLIMRWINGLIFWPLPIWAFAALYLALFALVLALLWRAPPEGLGRSAVH